MISDVHLPPKQEMPINKKVDFPFSSPALSGKPLQCTSRTPTPFTQTPPEVPSYRGPQILSFLTSLTELATGFINLISISLLTSDKKDDSPLNTASSSSAPTEKSPSSSQTINEGTKPSTIHRLNHSGEFLWKPVSEKDGKLVILLPSKFTDKVSSLRILSADGKREIAKGKFSGVANENREHYRFEKAGTDFPKRSIVEFVTKNGDLYHIGIAEPSKQFVR